jgi:hypothetical protein
MAKMIVGVYSKNISFTENKTNDLYITIDNENLFFSVKNSTNGQFIAFEHFKSVADEKGWESLILITQHNSKLINLHFGNVFFVWNNSRFILTKKVCCVEFTEVNPLLDNKGNKMAETAFEILDDLVKHLSLL